MSDHKVWVIAETDEGAVADATLEVLGDAIALAKLMQSEVAAVLLGEHLGDMSQTPFHYGATLVYLMEHDLLARYSTDAHVKALADLIREHAPEVILCAATRNGLDWAPRLAARLGAGMASDCTMLKRKGPVVEMTQPICDDRVYRTLVCEGRPVIAALRPGAIGKEAPDESRRGEVVLVRPTLSPADIRTQVVQSYRADARELEVVEADRLVIGGRGVGTKEQWALIDDLAAALGAGVAGSRMAMDAGWIERTKLIGQTGSSVAPKLCFEVGVSGAIQHTAGLRDARYVVAVNKDRYAPIFKVAKVGLVADLHALLPVLSAKIRGRRDTSQPPS